MTNMLIQVLRFLFPRLTLFLFPYKYFHFNQNTNINTNPNTNHNIDIDLNTSTLTGTNTHSKTNCRVNRACAVKLACHRAKSAAAHLGHLRTLGLRCHFGSSAAGTDLPDLPRVFPLAVSVFLLVGCFLRLLVMASRPRVVPTASLDGLGRPGH